MQIPGRTFIASNNSYFYGFNGKEIDKDISTQDYDFGMRIYDARIGKFLSVDPLTNKFPWYTPYQYAGNGPIWAVDLDGAEDLGYSEKMASSTNGRLLIRITRSTDVGKNFIKVLKSQNKVDVYYYSFVPEEMSMQGEISINFGVDKDGFIKGVKGQTNFVNSKRAFNELRSKDPYVYNVDPADIQHSFDQGKSVVLIGIAQPVLDYIDNLARQQKNSPEDLKKQGWTNSKTKNVILDAAHILLHEELAHALENITTNANNSDPITDHLKFSGEASTDSPPVWKFVLDKKYKETPAAKMVRELMKEIEKVASEQAKKAENPK